MKKYILIIIALLLTVFSNNAGNSFDVQWNDPAAKVSYVHQREYYDVMLELIHKAQKSIIVSMYLIDNAVRGDEPLVSNLCEALVKAKNRGVKVRVILENTISLNRGTYAYLKENGIETYWDHSTQVTHSKLVVIDERYSVVGSPNWSERAFRMNNEATVLVDSVKIAQVALAELSQQKLVDIRDAKVKEDRDAVYVPKEFILNKENGPKMISTSSDRAFDLYLALLYISQNKEGKTETTINLDYNTLAQYFGILKEGKLQAYRHGVRKELNKLADKYHLIKWTSEHGENPIIELIDLAQSDQPMKIKKQEFIPIPRKYWEYEFNRNLSLTAKLMYLIGIYESKISPTKPWWSMSQEDIVEKYGIQRWSVYTGSAELKKDNIFEIEYARTAKDKKGEFDMRPPNKYKVNELISEQEREETYNALKEECGEDNFTEAQQMAVDLDEPNDPLVIEVLLDLIKIHGLEKVKDAVAIPAGYKADNSMKHIRYVIGILQREKETEK